MCKGKWDGWLREKVAREGEGSELRRCSYIPGDRRWVGKLEGGAPCHEEGALAWRWGVGRERRRGDGSLGPTSATGDMDSSSAVEEEASSATGDPCSEPESWWMLLGAADADAGEVEFECGDEPGCPERCVASFFSFARLFWNQTWTSRGVMLSLPDSSLRLTELGFLSVTKTSSRMESWWAEVRLRVLTALGT